MMRWFAVRETRVVESDDPVNHRYVDGRLESAVVTFEPLPEGHRVEWNPFKHDEYWYYCKGVDRWGPAYVTRARPLADCNLNEHRSAIPEDLGLRAWFSYSIDPACCKFRLTGLANATSLPGVVTATVAISIMRSGLWFLNAAGLRQQTV